MTKNLSLASSPKRRRRESPSCLRAIPDVNCPFADFRTPDSLMQKHETSVRTLLADRLDPERHRHVEAVVGAPIDYHENPGVEGSGGRLDGGEAATEISGVVVARDDDAELRLPRFAPFHASRRPS